MSQSLKLLTGAAFCAVFFTTAAPAQQVAAIAPAAPAERTYMVFFETGKSALAPEGREILRDAAVAARGMPVAQVRVMVPGEGSNPAALAQSRARSVKTELVQAGLKPDAIQIGGQPAPVAAPVDPSLQQWLDRRAVIVLSNNQTS